MSDLMPLEGQIALVAGATRGGGRGIARALAEAGAFVYCTGRTSSSGARGMERPETIEETLALIEASGGHAKALRVDHTEQSELEELASRIKSESGRLDVLVNSIWGADPMIDWGKRFWEVDVSQISKYIEQTITTHLITCRYLAPLMVQANSGLIVEVIDGHFSGYRGHILYDMSKAALSRFAYGMSLELLRTGVTALSLAPGFLRSEAVLDHFGVREDNWHDAIEKDPYFAESETPWLVGRAVAALAADKLVRKKAGLSLFASDLAREYGFTDVDGRVPDFTSLLDKNVERMAGDPSLSEDEQSLLWIRYCQIHKDPSYESLALKLSRALKLEDC